MFRFFVVGVLCCCCFCSVVFCTGWVMSGWGFVRLGVGFCVGGVMSGWGYVRVGFCPGGVLSVYAILQHKPSEQSQIYTLALVARDQPLRGREFLTLPTFWMDP